MRLATTILIILISLPTFAQANDYTKIVKQLSLLTDKHDLLILGEKHGKQESTKLFTALTNYLTKNHTCISVVLEISSDQQSAIDKAMSGSGSVSDINISSTIDHLGYRQMLSGLRGLTVEGRCLKVVAVDGYRQKPSRDEWMAMNIEPLLKGKVLFLVGNLHAIKKIRWESGESDPFLAERLVAKGYRVCSVMQLWEGGDSAVTELIVADAVRVLEPVAAYIPENASEFGGYVVHWE